MDGNDPTMNKIRLNHLIEVAEHFTGEDWTSDQVSVKIWTITSNSSKAV